MAVSGRHVPAGHHRGDDGGVGGERADGGAGSTGRRTGRAASASAAPRPVLAGHFLDRNEPARPQVGLVGATRARREFTVLSPALGADMGQSNPTSGYVRVRPQNAWLRAVNARSPGHPGQGMHSLSCMPPMTPAVRALTDLLSTLASPGQAPHRAARRPSAPRTQPMLEKATKSNTTRRYERPGTVGSSSHRHRRARTRGSGPAERRINRTQELRSVPATRLAAGHARLGLHPVLPSPAQREAARCHDQHKLPQRMPGR